MRCHAVCCALAEVSKSSSMRTDMLADAEVLLRHGTNRHAAPQSLRHVADDVWFSADI